jgi:hypothetical protein
MTDETMPTVEHVREQYARLHPSDKRWSVRRAAEFDRWLAAELNKARAEGWARGWVDGEKFFDFEGFGLDWDAEPTNPYVTRFGTLWNQVDS